MANQYFVNNVTVYAAQLIGASDTSIVLDDVSSLPNVADGDFFLLTFFRETNNIESLWEIVKCTAVDYETNTLTVERGQEGTSARAWSIGSKAQMRATAGTFSKLRDDIPDPVDLTAVNERIDTQNGLTINGVINPVAQVVDIPKVETDNAALDTPLNAQAQAVADRFAYLAGDDGSAMVGIGGGRTQADKNAELVSVKDFGAVGDGVTDDTAAIQAAVDYLYSNGGGELRFCDGAVYRSGTVKLPAGIRVNLNGSTIKLLDNQLDFARLFTMLATGYQYTGDSDSKPTIIENGTLDVNRENQGTYTGYELEHQAAISVGAVAGNVGKVVVHFRDLIIKESCGDGINLYYNVKGTIENCHFINHFRGGIVSSGGGHDLTIRDCTSGGDVHDKFIDFEPTPSVGSAYTLNINDCVVGGKIDISTDYCENSRVTLRNVHMGSPSFNIFGEIGSVFIVDNCTLYTTDNPDACLIRQHRNITFIDCTFIGTKTLAGATPPYGVYFYNDGIAGQVAKFIRCEFIADSSILVGGTSYGIYQAAVQIAEVGSITLEECKFTGFTYAAYTRGMPVSAYNCTASGMFFRLEGTVSTYENAITVGGFLSIPAATAPFRQASSVVPVRFYFRNYQLNAGDGASGSGESTLLFSGFTNVSKSIGHRYLSVTGTPACGALVGDIAIKTSPTYGEASEWISTSNHNTAAVWRMSKQFGIKKDITANRPSPASIDIGLLYLDTTLDSDGKPIWWNGTAWVDVTGATV